MNPVTAHMLKAVLHGDAVLLSYHLGVAEGITLFSKRGLEAEFSAFAEDEPSPLVDYRPKLVPDQPETRHYRAVLSYRSNAMCQLSNEIVLTLP